MKRKSIKLVVSMILILIVSCNEPETVVTDYVHPDGSVTRKIEMKSIEGDVNKRFKISDIQVPLDSSWSIRDSCEVDKKGDTTWIRRAEKLFKSIDEINLTYKSDSGSNKKFSRQAGFNKKFKWFNTEFRFSEKIDKKLSFGYPVKDFLNNEELLYFYSPEKLKSDKENGPDSLKFRALNDSVKHKTDKWTEKNMVSEWIGDFSGLTAGKADKDISLRSLKSRENEFVTLIEKNDKQLDSLWKNGILLKEFLGEENALKYKTEADSALSIVTNNIWANFNDYSMRIVMPGKLIGTNGFVDSSHILLWPVKSDFFMTEPYEMWAESKIPNKWAWIVSGLFLVFVLSGVIMKVIKKD
ncbi:MAG: hypothetical protein ABR927_16830 [Bacteroidales bacterium]|jgi:hypothetical protein